MTLAEIYVSELDQTGAQMFCTSVTINNYIVLGADVTNAFSEALPLISPLYVQIGENYQYWYNICYLDNLSQFPTTCYKLKKPYKDTQKTFASGLN